VHGVSGEIGTGDNDYGATVLSTESRRNGSDFASVCGSVCNRCEVERIGEESSGQNGDAFFGGSGVIDSLNTEDLDLANAARASASAGELVLFIGWLGI